MIKVSIIIPVYNDEKYLISTLAAISPQINDKKHIEIIIVDNGSSDTFQWLEQSEQIKLLREKTNLNSPYSCRNRGIEIAKGDIIVLLDATCCPQNDWLEKGLNYLDTTKADIVGGNVLFDFAGKVTGAKLYDAMTNIKMEESIKKGVAKTANLFIKKSVFDKIGLFPEGIRSGADVRWTYKATSNGLKLVFCHDAIVYKPARGFKELLKKQWRVGLHQPLIWHELGKRKSKIGMVARLLTPVNPVVIKKNMDKRFGDEARGLFIPLLFSAQLSKSIMGLANLIGSFSKK
ncbi:Glycosyltransferase, GT2 family [Parapedobacter luteus]|uniref:Glycosyltransferase, GT2 family n=1 Tax=Parapedobacter luteus TaxID=623280 RepID=A0A1T5DG01_9SPHI|nr:glycosyltransferase [Parapedobacter luteus]SKB70619.1 Glycosyltransferase, GT2 family [Parapedobacter luteus]